ncbi:hypothetical protein EDC27_1706 [Desulfosoma caldarium]|uniref:Uncharacterized protein n=1 Tax=Desulfosoma caldarium TaxID=610254 RepID=A0A3N1ULD2_9BACT|nr:hypothetical protein EDC27_1706 [Desulfosoma caldarium]
MLVRHVVHMLSPDGVQRWPSDGVQRFKTITTRRYGHRAKMSPALQALHPVPAFWARPSIPGHRVGASLVAALLALPLRNADRQAKSSAVTVARILVMIPKGHDTSPL